MPDQGIDHEAVAQEMEAAQARLFDTIRHQMREISSATRVDDTIVAAHDMNVLFDAMRNIGRGIPS